ncbi:hypothetical protein KY363_03915 [Candidatus Woesearchaeota archaeon]|nr:hypothetical protein [Candidatus Woesearchaeota archaeon]
MAIEEPEEQVEEAFEEPALKHEKLWRQLDRKWPKKYKIKDERLLEDILYAEHNTVHPNLLMGLLWEECRFDLAIGCNKSRACGPAQMKEVAVGDTLMILYAANGRFADYRKAFGSNILMKRAVIDGITDGYFSDTVKLYEGVAREKEKILAEIRKAKADMMRSKRDHRELTKNMSRMNAQIRRLARNWTKNKDAIYAAKTQYGIYADARAEAGKAVRDDWRRVRQLSFQKANLWYIETVIEAGYSPGYKPAIRPRKKYMAIIGKDIGNDELSRIAGVKKDWLAHLNAQYGMVTRVYDYIKDKEHAEANIVLADTLFGYYLFRTKSLDRSLRKYNGGTASRTALYSMNVHRFYRLARGHASIPPRPKWLRQNPYGMIISRSDGKR